MDSDVEGAIGGLVKVETYKIVINLSKVTLLPVGLLLEVPNFWPILEQIEVPPQGRSSKHSSQRLHYQLQISLTVLTWMLEKMRHRSIEQ